jgi:hypothetical protein
VSRLFGLRFHEQKGTPNTPYTELRYPRGDRKGRLYQASPVGPGGELREYGNSGFEAGMIDIKFIWPVIGRRSRKSPVRGIRLRFSTPYQTEYSVHAGTGLPPRTITPTVDSVDSVDSGWLQLPSFHVQMSADRIIGRSLANADRFRRCVFYSFGISIYRPGALPVGGVCGFRGCGCGWEMEMEMEMGRRSKKVGLHARVVGQTWTRAGQRWNGRGYGYTPADRVVSPGRNQRTTWNLEYQEPSRLGAMILPRTSCQVGSLDVHGKEARNQVPCAHTQSPGDPLGLDPSLDAMLRRTR